MTSLVSIRLNDELLQKTKAHAHVLHLSQTDYIRKAIERMNHEAEKNEREQRLKRVSLLVRKESIAVNAEFGEIDDDPHA